MEKFRKQAPALMLGLGFAGLLLRLGVYARAVDEKGLLIPHHPLLLALWVLTAVAAAGAVLLPRSDAPEKRDPLREALGEGICGLGLALAAVTGISAAATALDGAQLVMCLTAGGCLAFAAVRRLGGKPPFMPCYAVVCLFLALYLVCRYRGWSAHPQIQDWFFQVMGAVCGMIFAYLRCVPGKFRLRRTVALLGIFTCLTALSSSADPTLCFGLTAWMLTGHSAPGEDL